MTWQDVNLEGIFETARLSGLSLQTAARHSPGAAISSMLLITALRRGVLAPYQKEQSEIEKSALELTHSDKGGLVFAPIIGVHENVIEVDFSSMFPMVARVYDISPETIDDLLAEAERDPRFDPQADQERLGLLPTALSPMLDKRLWYKQRLTELEPDDPRHATYSGRLKAQKWIGVVAYGRTKYKEDTHARVEVHETITNYARKSLIQAKIVAEELGFRFLHGYIDALYLQKPPGAGPAEVQHLIDEIIRSTKLPIVLEGEYHWMAFLPSRRNPRIPAANKFFGLKVDGEFKIRGIEARRNDTPVIIARYQQELLELLTEGRTLAELRALLPRAVALVQCQVRDIRRRAFDVADLQVRLTLSREVDQYKVNTAAVRAALQMMRAGKKVGAGDKVRFVYTLGKDRVTAWDPNHPPDPRTIDAERYVELLLRSVFTVLQPLDVTEEMIENWVMANAGYMGRPGVLAPAEGERLPLLVNW
jgi:DNA polymerase-2